WDGAERGQDPRYDRSEQRQDDALPETLQVDTVGGGVDVAEREAAVVVLEGADRDGHHRRDQEQRHVNPEGDDASGPAQPAQQLRYGRPGRRSGVGRGFRPGNPGTRNGSRGPASSGGDYPPAPPR